MTMTFLAASAATMTLLEAWEHGGWVMWVLLGMSVIGATFCLYFLATLRERAVAPRSLRRDLPRSESTRLNYSHLN